jgi:nucleoid-associated protein YgaU
MAGPGYVYAWTVPRYIADLIDSSGFDLGDSGFCHGDAGALRDDVAATNRVVGGGVHNFGRPPDGVRLVAWVWDVIRGGPIPNDAKANFAKLLTDLKAQKRSPEVIARTFLAAWSSYVAGAGLSRTSYDEIWQSKAEDAAIRARSGATLARLGDAEKARDAVTNVIGSTVSGAVKGATSALKSGLSLATAPIKLGNAIVHGANVGQALVETAKSAAADVKAVIPVARQILSYVPGVGTGINAALSAGQALAEGKRIDEVLLAATRSALPGGELAAAGFDTALAVVKGGNISAAVLDVARRQIPPAAQPAFDVGVALARGQSLQQAATNAAKGYAGKAMQSVIPMTNIPDVVSAGLSKAAAPLSMLPTSVAQVAQGLLQNPALRSLPLAAVAKRLGVDQNTARRGMASVVQAIQKTGAGGAATRAATSALSLAPHIENVLGGDTSLDRAMAMVGRASPARFTNNAVRGKNPIRWRNLPASMVSRIVSKVPALSRLPAAALSGATLAHYVRPPQARGLDSSGTVYVVDPGDNMSKIAQKVVGSASRWPELRAANPQVSNPDAIYAGQRLSLPASWAKAPAAGSGSASTATPLTGHGTISQGSTGADVMAWQVVINVTPDGQFGPVTAQKTAAWQAAHGLPADGVVGPMTWAAAAGSVGATMTTPNVSPVGTVSPNVPAGSTGATYTVQSGDNMSKIALKFTGSAGRWTELRTANPQVSDPNKIYPGQVLKLPSGWSTAASTSPVSTAPVPGVPASTPSTTVIPSGGILQWQIMLVHWGAITRKIQPPDYGSTPGDYNGSDSARFRAAIKSFQVTFTRSPSGEMDDDTYQRLVAWNANALGVPASSVPSATASSTAIQAAVSAAAQALPGGGQIPGIAGGGTVPGVLPTVIGTQAAPVVSGGGTIVLPNQTITASLHPTPTAAQAGGTAAGGGSGGGIFLPLAAAAAFFFM